MRCYDLIRPALFLLPPETAHRAAIAALRARLMPTVTYHHSALNTSIGALALPNPIGLAAGFDKNAEAMDGFLDAGFGFVEIGTVTPKAQPGNPQPRLFRLVEEEAVINRLGFNNEGVGAAASRLAARAKRGVVGGNIGKNKDTEDALTDYAAAMRVIYSHVDYITANISSPNTPGLRNLQHADALRRLVQGLHAVRTELVAAGAVHKPIWVKLSPDNDQAMLEAIAEVALSEHIDALIISNTTIDRSAVMHHPLAKEAGGLSGKPLMEKATETLRAMYALTQGQIPLIGVGGIASAEDAYRKIRAGASAVQLYTALVYQGMGLVERIQRDLVELMARDGFSNVQEAVGADAR